MFEIVKRICLVHVCQCSDNLSQLRCGLTANRHITGLFGSLRCLRIKFWHLNDLGHFIQTGLAFRNMVDEIRIITPAHHFWILTCDDLLNASRQKVGDPVNHSILLSLVELGSQNRERGSLSGLRARVALARSTSTGDTLDPVVLGRCQPKRFHHTYIIIIARQEGDG